MIHVSILFSSAFWREGLPIGNEENQFEQKFGFQFCDIVFTWEMGLSNCRPLLTCIFFFWLGF